MILSKFDEKYNILNDKKSSVLFDRKLVEKSIKMYSKSSMKKLIPKVKRIDLRENFQLLISIFQFRE